MHTYTPTHFKMHNHPPKLNTVTSSYYYQVSWRQNDWRFILIQTHLNQMCVKETAISLSFRDRIYVRRLQNCASVKNADKICYVHEWERVSKFLGCYLLSVEKEEMSSCFSEFLHVQQVWWHSQTSESNILWNSANCISLYSAVMNLLGSATLYYLYHCTFICLVSICFKFYK